MDKDLGKLCSMRDAELPGCGGFLRAWQYTAEVGMEQDYKHLNPIFSNLVHPTSWSVHWKQELLDKTHMRGFIITIRAHFIRSYRECHPGSHGDSRVLGHLE